MENPVDLMLPVALGIGLAAAAGFRVFLPILATGLAVKGGYLPITESFQWIATTPALIMLAVAALVEIIAYYIPVLDNLLDGIASPTAVGAGIAMSYAVMGDMPPMLKWTLAIIAGGGAAAATQGATSLLRGVSTASTAGLGNHILATTEIAGAIGMSLLAIVFPYVALIAVLVFIFVAWRIMLRFMRRNAEETKGTVQP
jgi:Domain of unknown function (DUF4126)